MSDTTRYGIIGTGMMGCEHILNLMPLPGAEVVAIADPHPASRELAGLCLGDSAPSVEVFDDPADLLATGGLDAVVVATPNHTHRRILESIDDPGLHVLVEKPLCTTVDDALAVADWASARSGVTWVGLEYRFMPTVSALIAQHDTGVCGTTRMVSIREHRFPFLEKVDNWNRFSENTGGTLVEKCCHFFDLMRLLAGSNPTTVMASGGQDVNHLDEIYDGRRSDILDNAYVIVEFENGVRGLLDLSMFAEGGRYEQEITVVGDAAKLEATVPGDTVWVGPRHEPGQREVAAPLSPEVSYEGFHHGSSYLEHLGFLDAIRAGRPAPVDVDAGVWSVAMGAAAHRSIDERRVVDLDEFGVRG